MIRKLVALVLAFGLNSCAGVPSNLVKGSRGDALFATETKDVRALATRAYVWGMPLVEAALIRTRFAESGAPFNRFSHRRSLAGPEMRAGVAPNNDTLYSLAWVDLAFGPLVVTMPDFGQRYYTISINQADSSAEHSFGQRTHSGQLPPLFLHRAGSPDAVPPGMIDVPILSRFANLAGRILVRGAGDFTAVHALQDGMAIHRSKDWAADMRSVGADVGATGLSPRSGLTEGARFFAQLGEVLEDWPPHGKRERAMIASLTRLGLGGGKNPRRLSNSEQLALADGFEAGKRLVAQRSLHLGEQHDGWTTNYRGPRFGADWLLRAGVAKDQIFVAVPEEAIYPVGRSDSDGKPLTGAHRYQIRFAPGKLPSVGAFWSVTAYGDDGFMIPNAIARYSVGDRTPGLVRDSDGSVTIVLAWDEPREAGINWLPVGPGPFFVMLRLYRPLPSVIDRSWRPPAIQRIKPREL
ncbi:MAG: DUF1214 domain-containing protein [Novosphingobium sp.]|nr:DUF1214 domain-containing protein [Novosphingobium sp.]